MPVFRSIILLLLVAAALSFAMYIGTRQPRYLSWGIRILKWTLAAALGFFAVLIVERLARGL